MLTQESRLTRPWTKMNDRLSFRRSLAMPSHPHSYVIGWLECYTRSEFGIGI
jgi:hypothetical protein